MNYRTAHRSGNSKFQSRSSMATAGKNAIHKSHPRRTAKLLSLIGCILFVLTGIVGLAFAVQQSTTTPEQAHNPELYPSYRGNAWAMLQLQGR